MFQLFAEAAQQSSMYSGILMLVLAVVFFYFIILRPEQKRRKTQETKRSSIKKGDQVTAMGIIGIVEKINDQSLIIRSGGGSKLEILKLAVTDVKPATEDAKVESIETK